MKPLVHVPHRGKLPTTQFAHRSPVTERILETSTPYEVAMDLTYEERMAYSGYPDVQAEILREAVDDLHFADEVREAAERIAGVAVLSPTFALGELTVKDETEQLTRAYKVRGATNFIVKHLEVAKRAGVITASAGNHGQGVALAAGKVGIHALIVVPKGTPSTKTDGIREYGGQVIEFGDDYTAASHKAMDLNQQQKGLYVPAYNHRDIMAGQATIGLELREQIPEMTDLYVPTGGGGLLGGLSKYLATTMPAVRLWACGVTGSSAVANAMVRGNGLKTVTSKFADGIAVEQLGDQTWPEIHKRISGAVEVDEYSLRRLVGSLSLAGHVFEGAGTVGVAAAMQNHTQHGGKKVAIATGGNIDQSVLRECQEIALSHES